MEVYGVKSRSKNPTILTNYDVSLDLADYLAKGGMPKDVIESCYMNWNHHFRFTGNLINKNIPELVIESNIIEFSNNDERSEHYYKALSRYLLQADRKKIIEMMDNKIPWAIDHEKKKNFKIYNEDTHYKQFEEQKGFVTVKKQEEDQKRDKDQTQEEDQEEEEEEEEDQEEDQDNKVYHMPIQKIFDQLEIEDDLILKNNECNGRYIFAENAVSLYQSNNLLNDIYFLIHLRHKSISPCLGWNKNYLIVPYYHQTLADLLATNILLLEKIKIIKQLIFVAYFLQSKNVTIKEYDPSKILIVQDNSNEIEVKLIDFFKAREPKSFNYTFANAALGRLIQNILGKDIYSSNDKAAKLRKRITDMVNVMQEKNINYINETYELLAD